KLWRPSTQRIEPSEKKSLKQIRSLKNRRQLGGISGQFSSIPATHRRYPDNEQKNRDAQLRRKMAESPSRAGGKTARQAVCSSRRAAADNIRGSSRSGSRPPTTIPEGWKVGSSDLD